MSLSIEVSNYTQMTLMGVGNRVYFASLHNYHINYAI